MKHIGFLAVLFVVLLGAVIVKETSRPDAGSLREQLPQQALGAKPWKIEDAARIVVQGPGKSDAFTLKKADGVWTVEDPFRAPAAAGVVERFVTAVNEARGELRLDDTAALAKFDLDDSRATRVTVEDAAGSALVNFALGKSSGQQGAFVRPLFDGVRDGAYAVSQDLRGALGLTKTQPGDANVQSPQPSHFHDLALPPIVVGEAARLELTTPNWAVVFDKRGPAWLATAGAPEAPMRSQGVDSLVRQFGASTTATALVDPATLADTGLAEPTYVAQVTHLDGQTRKALGAAKDGTYTIRFDTEAEPQVIYELTRYAFDRLFPKGGTLFEFAPLDADELTRLDVKRNGRNFSLTRPGPSDDWTVAEPAWPLVPAVTQLRSLGSLLRSVRAVDWYAGSFAFEEETMVTYGTQATADDTPAVLRIGQDAPGGGGKLAKLPGAEDVVVIADSVAARLQADPLTLFEPQPLGANTRADDLTTVIVRDITLSDDTRTEAFRLVAGDEGWSVVRAGEPKPGADIPIEFWLETLIDVEITTRSDYVGPFEREIEVQREGSDPLVMAFGSVSEELGTAIRVGDVTFFADVDEELAQVDPAKLVRPESPETPDENGDNGDSE